MQVSGKLGQVILVSPNGVGRIPFLQAKVFKEIYLVVVFRQAHTKRIAAKLVLCCYPVILY
jgi:hypothetical protein